MNALVIAATPYFSNRGCHIRIFMKAKHLKKKGENVLLCTYHLGENLGDFPIKTISRVSWYKKTSPGFAWGKIYLDLKLLFLCVREIRRFNPDVIHAHLFEGLAVGLLAKILAFRPKIPIVIDSQGDLNAEFQTYNKESEFLRKVFVWFGKKIVGFADHVVLSSENARPFFERFPKLKNKISVVKDGVDLSLFTREEEDEMSSELKKELNEIKVWKGDKNLLIYTGGMEDGKGVRELLEEFLRAKDELGNWKLVLFGEGSCKEEYKELVKKSGAEDLVYFPRHSGFFELPHFLRLSNVSIDPKQKSTEGSGKLVNYMAAGLPVICFEKQFNRSRLGERGFYISKISEMKDLLGSKDFIRIQYDLSKEDERDQTDKLHEIFKQLTQN